MFSRKFFIPFAASALLFAAACETEEGPGPSLPGGSMSGTVEGAPWGAQYVQYARPNANTVQFVGGRDNAGNPTVIGVELTAYNDTGVYLFNGTSRRAYVLLNSVYYYAHSGQINVTQDDSDWFKATFAFQGQDSLSTDMRSAAGTFIYKKK